MDFWPGPCSIGQTANGERSPWLRASCMHPIMGDILGGISISLGEGSWETMGATERGGWYSGRGTLGTPKWEMASRQRHHAWRTAIGAWGSSCNFCPICSQSLILKEPASGYQGQWESISFNSWARILWLTSCPALHNKNCNSSLCASCFSERAFPIM